MDRQRSNARYCSYFAPRYTLRFVFLSAVHLDILLTFPQRIAVYCSPPREDGIPLGLVSFVPKLSSPLLIVSSWVAPDPPSRALYRHNDFQELAPRHRRHSQNSSSAAGPAQRVPCRFASCPRSRAPGLNSPASTIGRSCLTFYNSKSFQLRCRMLSNRSLLHPMTSRKKVPESRTVSL